MSVCTSTFMAAPNTLSDTPSNSSAMETPENLVEDPDDPESADKGAIQMKYFCDYLKSPSTRAVSKYNLQESGPLGTA